MNTWKYAHLLLAGFADNLGKIYGKGENKKEKTKKEER
jgi:glycerol dehydrogenase-like iron-containing ADH family enzyme